MDAPRHVQNSIAATALKAAFSVDAIACRNSALPRLRPIWTPRRRARPMRRSRPSGRRPFGLLRLAPPRCGERHHQIERAAGAVTAALLEVAVDASELIGHMGETDYRTRAGDRKGVKRRRLHLDRQYTFGAAARDRGR